MRLPVPPLVCRQTRSAACAISSSIVLIGRTRMHFGAGLSCAVKSGLPSPSTSTGIGDAAVATGSLVNKLELIVCSIACCAAARSCTSLLPTSCRCCPRSEEHTSELQSRRDIVCRLLLEKKKNKHDSACCKKKKKKKRKRQQV